MLDMTFNATELKSEMPSNDCPLPVLVSRLFEALDIPSNIPICYWSPVASGDSVVLSNSCAFTNSPKTISTVLSNRGIVLDGEVSYRLIEELNLDCVITYDEALEHPTQAGYSAVFEFIIDRCFGTEMWEYLTFWALAWHLTQGDCSPLDAANITVFQDDDKFNPLLVSCNNNYDCQYGNFAYYPADSYLAARADYAQHSETRAGCLEYPELLSKCLNKSGIAIKPKRSGTEIVVEIKDLYADFGRQHVIRTALILKALFDELDLGLTLIYV